MLELLAYFLAGLALFFHGVGGIRSQLQGLTSRRLRRQLARLAGHPVLSALWGVGFGAITQSSTAVAFILTGLVQGQLITVTRALPIVACANLGTAALVFFASFNVHIAFLYVLGLTGLALAFDLGGNRAKPVLGTLFCAGVLFFGLKLMKDAFAPIGALPWFQDVAEFMHDSTFVVFVVGALARVLVQSSAGIAVIAISLEHGGLLTPDQATMMIYGAGAGVGLSIFLLSSNLRGIGRRLALFQGGITGISALVLGTLFYVEKLTGMPLLLAAATRLGGSESLRLAFAYLFLQLASVTIAALFARSAAGWLERWAPATRVQELMRPEFITDQAVHDPEAALDLAEKEQLRLLSYLPGQLASIRPDTAAAMPVAAGSFHDAIVAVGADVRAFLHELTDQPSDHATSERLLVLQTRQSLIGALDDTVHSFVQAFGEVNREAAGIGTLPGSLVESLDLLLRTATDTIESGNAADYEMVRGMTADRSEVLERMRRHLLGGANHLDQQQKSHLFYLTSLYERAVWLLRQLVQARTSGATM